MSKQEKIVCPALSIDYETSERCNNEMRLNGVDWSLIRGSDAYKEIRIFLGVTSTREGFTTSKDRFVNAKEAMSIAINNNQIKELEDLHTRWIMWQLAGDERWKDVRECWRELKIDLESRELKPGDLY